MTQRHRPRFIGLAMSLLLSVAFVLAACGGSGSSFGTGPDASGGMDNGSFDTGPAGSGDTGVDY